VAMSTGVPVSDVNWVCHEKPLNDKVSPAVAAIKNYYSNLNLHFWWWAYPGAQSPETDRILKTAGFRQYVKVSCMAADLSNLLADDAASDHIRIAPVKNQSDLLEWKNVSFEGFEMPARAQDPYEKFVTSFDLSTKTQQRLFIAYFDEKPVASSMLFVHQKTAGIYYVSTLPSYRNKGCGLKITQATMKEAKNSGFKKVVLQATPMGMPVYQRVGFRECCRAQIYRLQK